EAMLHADIKNVFKYKGVDIISKNILSIAEKKIRKGMRFTESGFHEIEEFYEKITENVKLTLSAFARSDVELARKVLQNRNLIKSEEFESRQNHFLRLAKKETQAIETTSLHLDLLSNLCSIDMNISNVARLILEERTKSN
ncbi:MAG: Na/Pi cotransporter family protein, partial [Deltaproteobacteria bacterium]|nr:Na/Pi cotransporter family protein [Deltaproteobacteria bacterium]